MNEMWKFIKEFCKTFPIIFALLCFYAIILQTEQISGIMTAIAFIMWICISIVLNEENIWQ